MSPLFLILIIFAVSPSLSVVARYPLDLNNGKIFKSDYIKEDLPKDDDNYLDIVDSLDANFLVNGYFDDNKGFVVADHYHGKVNGITASLYHLLVYNAQGKVESSVLGYCCQHSQSGDTDDVARGKLTIKKNDAERAEHTMNGVIASESSDYGKISNDNESKYAQGDASLEKAVYKVYNISDHYVYTIGSNDGTTRTRVETGKNTFKNLTGIDVDTLTFKSCIYNEKLSNIIDDEMMSKIQESLSNNVCYTLTTDKNGVASTVDNALPYGTYLVMEYTPSNPSTPSLASIVAKIADAFDVESATTL